jgi:putative spermidine/putrescine transport system permease protein
VRVPLVVWCGLVMVFLVGPIIMLVPLSLNPQATLAGLPTSLSLRWYQRLFSDSAWASSFVQSVAIAALATLIATTIGLAAAFAMVRGHSPIKRVAYLVVLAPLIVPTVVSAASMYLFFAGVRLDGSPLAIALGQAVLAMPIAVVILSATLRGFDERVEMAAVSLGASPLVALWRVTLPIIWPGVASALAFAFVAAFDELLVALFLSTPFLQTLPVRIWSSVQFEIEPTVAAVSVLLVALLGVIWVISTGVQRIRSVERHA